ncbi:MAG: hypothetical protein AAF559_03525 [Pseudomonadota bacterium]
MFGKFYFQAVSGGMAILLISGCSASSSPEEAEPPPEPDSASGTSELSAESLVMAETAWLSVSEEGVVYTTFLDPDGRYRDVRDGEIAYQGTWEQNASSELCFSPDTGIGACWEHGAPGLDGVMRATNRAGRSVEVKRISYIPPASPAPSEPASDANADSER